MTADELDASFVVAVTGAETIVRVERVRSLWGGYGDIFRVELGGAPVPSVVVKSVRPPAHARAEGGPSHARKCRSYDVELRFYREHAERTDAGCRTPRLIDARRDDDRWLFVLEDLDRAGFSVRRRVLTPDETDRCLRWLARFHARFSGAEPVGLWRCGTYWHLDTRREELERIRDPELRHAAPILDRKLNEAKFKTLVHGDAKIENFCFSPGSPDVAAVDFQYTGGGVGVKDVAYLLEDRPAPRSDGAESRFLDRYFAELGEALSDTDVDAEALENEWRNLYPIARADFHRFLAGWAPREYESDALARRRVAEVLQAL
jgi:hypothetical protein